MHDEEIDSLISISADDLTSSKGLYDMGQYRNSVVLAYYSMYSIARALLLKKDIAPKTHSGLIRELGRVYVIGEGFDKNLASDFSTAMIYRNDASYPTFDTFDGDAAMKIITLAESFIDEAMKFL